MKIGYACPSCESRLKLNLHRFELLVRVVDLGAFLLLLILSHLASDNRFFYAAILLSGLTEVGLWIWSKKRLGSWKRYVLLRQA